MTRDVGSTERIRRMLTMLSLVTTEVVTRNVGVLLTTPRQSEHGCTKARPLLSIMRVLGCHRLQGTQ